jgi:YozE SAM-like fold
MTFNEWFRMQEKRNDPVGDTSRDAAWDSSFPRQAGLARQVRYLRDGGACEEAIDALKEAWVEFECVVPSSARPR